jgi:lipooligosaccharide transport system permease protein
VHPALAVLEYHLTTYRRVWRGSVFSSFLMPVLFFLGMGVAVGGFVDSAGGLDQPYVEFIGPGLVAFTAFQVGAFESMYPVMGGFKWHRTYYGMAAAPLRVGDIVGGHLAFIGLRVATSAAAFTAVMAAFGAVGSAWAVVMPAVGLLLGMSISAPLFAFAASVNNDNYFAITMRLALMPMMLFAGVFFPVEQLPELARPVAYLTPLWHGVELCRAAAAGVVPPLLWLHIGYLMLWCGVGFVLARAAFARRLAV